MLFSSAPDAERGGDVAGARHHRALLLGQLLAAAGDASDVEQTLRLALGSVGRQPNK